jgi:V8-like Glu-specific endopeptidase
MLRVFVLCFSVVCASRTSFASDYNKVVYGDDDRVSVLDSDLKSTAAQAIATRVNVTRLIPTADGNFTASSTNTMRNSMQVCAEEKFSNEPLLGTCTGFLIAPNLLLSAGHCMVEKGELAAAKVTTACERNTWVFGFNQTTTSTPLSFNKDQVYNCKRVVYGTFGIKTADNDEGTDFAIVELDRNVVGRIPLTIRREGAVREGEKLFLLGHPSGLPLKYASGGEVVDSRALHYFVSNVDSFQGNSGSPVINFETGVVEGILVRGKKDFLPHPEESRQCRIVNRCDSNGNNCSSAVRDGMTGEHVTKITSILRFLP